MSINKVIEELAIWLNANNLKMKVPDLARFLNNNHFRTTYGKPFKGKRGTFRRVASAYKAAMKHGNPSAANAIWNVFK